MTFDFFKFYLLANKLEKYDDEAYLRTAISRYYYALFSLARLYLIENENQLFLKRKSSKVHQDIINYFQWSNDETEQNLGKILYNLRKFRNIADYNWDIKYDFFKENLDLIKDDVENAKDVLNYLNN